MESKKELSQLAERLERLESLLSEQASVSRQTSRQSLIVALALSTVVLVFVVVNIMNVRREFQNENLQASLQKELRELKPAAMHHLSELGREVLPIYAQEARRQLVTMSPAIAAKVESEIDLLTEDVLTDTHLHLAQAESRALDQTEQVILENYPELLDELKRKALRQRIRAETESAVAKSIGGFERRFGKDLIEIEGLLLDFDLSDDESTPVDLQKRFLHLWLTLLDQEIMEL